MIIIWSDILLQYQFQDEFVIVRILEGLTKILNLGNEIYKLRGVNPMKNIVENEGIPKILESMQHHPNDRIYKLAFGILDLFFSDEKNAIQNQDDDEEDFE